MSQDRKEFDTDKLVIFQQYKEFWQRPIREVIDRFLKTGSEQDFIHVLFLRLSYAIRNPDDIALIDKIIAEKNASPAEPLLRARMLLVGNLWMTIKGEKPDRLPEILKIAAEVHDPMLEGLAHYVTAVGIFDKPQNLFSANITEIFEQTEQSDKDFNQLLNHLENAHIAGERVQSAGYELSFIAFFFLKQVISGTTLGNPIRVTLSVATLIERAALVKDPRALFQKDRKDQIEEAAKLGLPAAMQVVASQIPNSAMNKEQLIIFLRDVIHLSGHRDNNSVNPVLTKLLDIEIDRFEEIDVFDIFINALRELVKMRKTGTKDNAAILDCLVERYLIREMLPNDPSGRRMCHLYDDESLYHLLFFAFVLLEKSDRDFYKTDREAFRTDLDNRVKHLSRILMDDKQNTKDVDRIIMTIVKMGDYVLWLDEDPTLKKIFSYEAIQVIQNKLRGQAEKVTECVDQTLEATGNVLFPPLRQIIKHYLLAPNFLPTPSPVLDSSPVAVLVPAPDVILAPVLNRVATRIQPIIAEIKDDVPDLRQSMPPREPVLAEAPTPPVSGPEQVGKGRGGSGYRCPAFLRFLMPAINTLESSCPIFSGKAFRN